MSPPPASAAAVPSKSNNSPPPPAYSLTPTATSSSAFGPSTPTATTTASSPTNGPSTATPTPRKTVRFLAETTEDCARRSKPTHVPPPTKDRHGSVSSITSISSLSGAASVPANSGNPMGASELQQQQPHAKDTTNGTAHPASVQPPRPRMSERQLYKAKYDDDGPVAKSTLLQPRVAVVLGVPRIWHLPLFTSRALSVCPAIWWSLGIMIRLLVQLHALAVAGGYTEGLGNRHGGRSSAKAAAAAASLGINERTGLSLDNRLKLTETALAMIWCGASAYLSFFFTDCLMSRWLLNYTPQATIVRLLAINALNGYLTSWVIYLAGSGGDSRLLLPAWVAIAAILTGLYHGTQRKINIRKETSISISVFSGASFISMVSLLAQLYWDRPEYADVPVVSVIKRVCTESARLVSYLFDIGNIRMDL